MELQIPGNKLSSQDLVLWNHGHGNSDLESKPLKFRCKISTSALEVFFLGPDYLKFHM